MDMNHTNDDTAVEVLSSLEVPAKYYNRVKTGDPVLDEVFGGADLPGILPGASILFTGFPGAGKSTMALQMADLLQSNAGKSVLYNVGEENKFMVKMAADRLGLRQNFCISNFADTTKLLEYCEENDIDVLFQDSIQTLRNGDDLDGARLMKTVGHMLAAHASSRGMTAFIIGQITKTGEFSGPMQLKHTLDAHCHLSLNKENGNRIFELQKNRFGPAFMPYEFFMSANGLEFKQSEEDPVVRKTTTKAVQKKQAFVEKAKEMMLEGVKLSGYSSMEDHALMSWMSSEGWECSGQFWRGVVAMAAGELAKDRVSVKSCKLPRSGGSMVIHHYVER